MQNLPTTLEQWEGYEFEDVSELRVERGYIDHWLEAMRDANPLYWNEEVAKEIADGIVAPPAMLVTWLLAPRWSPRRPDEIWDVHADPAAGGFQPRRVPIEAHYRLKEFLGLKEGIVAGNEMEFYAPVRLGDRLRAISKACEIGEERTNRLGTGRAWTIEVRYLNQRDELVGIERYRFFSYNRKTES